MQNRPFAYTKAEGTHWLKWPPAPEMDLNGRPFIRIASIMYRDGKIWDLTVNRFRPTPHPWTNRSGRAKLVEVWDKELSSVRYAHQS